MITRQELRQKIVDQIENYDFDLYPIGYDEFVDKVIDYWYPRMKEKDLEFDDLCESWIIEADFAICGNL